MHRIDHATAAAVIPAPGPAGAPGFFTEGNPTLSIPPTVVSGDWANAVQEELVGAILAQGFVLDKGDRLQLAKALGRIAGGSLNLFLNPEGKFGQRGTSRVLGSAEVVTGPGPDHWWASAGGAGDVGTLDFSAGGAGVQEQVAAAPSPIRTRMRFQKTTNAATGVTPTLRQSVEHVVTLNGKVVVVAFDAFKFSGVDLPVSSCEVVQDFGSGGAPSADVTTVLTSIGAATIDALWRRFVFTGTLPSIVGKTLGTTGNHLKVRVRFGTNQLFDVFVSGFTFSRGSVDPGYQPRDDTIELDLLRRYYETTIDGTSWGNFTRDTETGLWDTAFAGAGVVATLGRRFKTQKYAVPAVTWRAHDGTANNITEGAATLHPVTSGSGASGPTPTHTGWPTITAPPASGLRDYRAYFEALSEVPD